MSNNYRKVIFLKDYYKQLYQHNIFYVEELHQYLKKYSIKYNFDSFQREKSVIQYYINNLSNIYSKANHFNYRYLFILSSKSDIDILNIVRLNYFTFDVDKDSIFKYDKMKAFL